jgi:hypothetical protein
MSRKRIHCCSPSASVPEVLPFSPLSPFFVCWTRSVTGKGRGMGHEYVNGWNRIRPSSRSCKYQHTQTPSSIYMIFLNVFIGWYILQDMAFLITLFQNRGDQKWTKNGLWSQLRIPLCCRHEASCNAQLASSSNVSADGELDSLRHSQVKRTKEVSIARPAVPRVGMPRKKNGKPLLRGNLLGNVQHMTTMLQWVSVFRGTMALRNSGIIFSLYSVTLKADKREALSSSS